VRFGSELTPQAMATLRLIKDAFGVVFKIKPDLELWQQQRSEQHPRQEEKDSDSESDVDDDDKAEEGKTKRRGVDLFARDPTILLSCLGIGYSNVNRKVT